MIADYFTKPLQGRQFTLFRDLIMGYKHIDDILSEIRSAAKERVEKRMKNRSVAGESLNKNKKTFKEALMTGLCKKN